MTTEPASDTPADPVNPGTFLLVRQIAHAVRPGRSVPAMPDQAT